MYFDTVITVSLLDYDGSSTPILDGCMDLCEKYENLLSSTVTGSDVWNINHSRGEPVTVSSDTAQLIDRALYYCESSVGAVDITLGGVSNLWGFSSANLAANPTPPSEAQIAEALTHVDYSGVHLIDSGSGGLEGEAQPQIILTDPEAQIELGFIAKGYIADMLGIYLEDCGVRSAIINLGGNVKVIGTKPDGSDFNIGIQKPFADMNETLTTVSCHDSSVVSSGIYERYYEYDGKLYHHILDSTTGYPCENDVTGVTIRTSSSTDADALSTLCFILGKDEGLKLIERLDDTEALYVMNGDSIITSSGW